jgi:hypothetical protein
MYTTPIFSVISKQERPKVLFVFRFSPEARADDVEKSTKK